MKYLILLIQLFVFHSTTWALTEIIESTNYGSTYIDPINNVARINIQSTLVNPNYQASPPSIECKKLKLVRQKNPASDCIQTIQVADPAQTCESLRKSVQGFIDCEEFDAAQMTIRDAQQCGTPATACQVSSTAKPYAVDQNLADSREKIRKCSPTHELLVITDSLGKNASVSSLKDLQQCGRNISGRPLSPNACGSDLRTIDTGDVLWDQQNRDEYRVKVGHTPGFYVGNHAHYFFDYAQKKWCFQFKPFQTVLDNDKPARTTATCVTPPVNAHPLEFSRLKSNGESEHITLGIVKLELDSSGQPIATVGQPTSEKDRQGRYTLNTSKPVLRVTLSNVNPSSNTTVGRRSTFELVNADGTARSSMTVSPSMVLGSNLNSPGSCRNSPGRYCLTASTSVSGAQNGENFCRNNNQSLPLSGATNGLCYSCNGITPGNCDQTTHLIQRTATSSTQADAFNRVPVSFSDVYNQLNSCYNGAPAAAPAGNPATAPTDVTP